MAILQLLQQLLTAKATAVLAAFALIGGGAAIAAPGMEDEPDDPVVVESETENAWALGRADNDQMERIGAFCVEHPEASFCSSDSHPVFSAPSEEPEDEIVAGGEEASTAEAGEEENGVEPDEDEDTRSATARRVHEALTGSEDITPGDPEFGRTVSERARSGKPGDLGDLVSRAARGEDLDEEDLELLERERTTSNEKPDENDGTEEESEAVESEASERPERGGPPADTPAGQKGKGPGSR